MSPSNDDDAEQTSFESDAIISRHNYDSVEVELLHSFSVPDVNIYGHQHGENLLAMADYDVHGTTTLLSMTTEADYDDAPIDYSLVSAPSHGYVVPICGYVSPPVILFTVVTNSLICLILLKKTMRSPTNTLLVGIALSDMLTGLIPLPSYLYYYTFGNYREWVSYSWCRVYIFFTDFTPTVFHTASIWLTVALAVQRYFYICRPTLAKYWCTVANAVKATTVVYAAAFLSQCTRFAELAVKQVEVASKIDNSSNVTACSRGYNSPFRDNLNTYFNIYWWLRVVLIHLIPCLTLIIFNALLIQAMRAAQKRRRQLLKQNRRTECRRLAENNLTTLMLVAVVGVFLVLEFPLALLLIVMIVDNTFGLSLLSVNSKDLSQTVINLCILLSYPLNFFIYCAMSRSFRQIFKGLFMPCCASADDRLAMNNATTTVTVNHTLAVDLSANPAKTIRSSGYGLPCCKVGCIDDSLSAVGSRLSRHKIDGDSNRNGRLEESVEEIDGQDASENLLAKATLLSQPTNRLGESTDEKTVYIELNG